MGVAVRGTNAAVPSIGLLRGDPVRTEATRAVQAIRCPGTGHCAAGGAIPRPPAGLGDMDEHHREP